jgi:hypothetical protein
MIFIELHIVINSRAIDLTQQHSQDSEIAVGYRKKYFKDYGGGKKCKINKRIK